MQQKDDGVEIATAVTDGMGRYRFDHLYGVNDTGNYTVHLVAPANTGNTSPDSVNLLIGCGDMTANVNFSLSDSGWTHWPGGDTG